MSTPYTNSFTTQPTTMIPGSFYPGDSFVPLATSNSFYSPETFTLPSPLLRTPLFDQFEMRRDNFELVIPKNAKVKAALFDPIQRMKLKKQFAPTQDGSGETLADRTIMYLQLKKALTEANHDHLDQLLQSGVLLDTSAQDGHSTLYHLYGILATPRADGLDSITTVNEMVQVLNKPYAITQMMDPLSDNISQEILRVHNQPKTYSFSRTREVIPPSLISMRDISFRHSALCDSSSVMFLMADQHPAELVRQVSGLTSPRRSFHRTLPKREILPDDPSQTTQILKDYNIPFYEPDSQNYTIRVELPQLGLLRAINDSRNPKERTGVEAAYQATLTSLGSQRTYDPATDLRYDAFSPEGSSGLSADETSIVETIVTGKHAALVTSMVVAGKANATPEEERELYLYGYTRTFEELTGDILRALKTGKPVIAGFVQTFPNGQVIAGQGHIVNIVGAFTDPGDGELKFIIVDSDDNIPEPVVHSARSLIPKIHHILPSYAIAKDIYKEMEAVPGYFMPSEEDSKDFRPLSVLEEPLPMDVFGPVESVDETLPESQTITPSEVTQQPLTPDQNWPPEVPTETYPLPQPQYYPQPFMPTMPAQSYILPTTYPGSYLGTNIQETPTEPYTLPQPGYYPQPFIPMMPAQSYILPTTYPGSYLGTNIQTTDGYYPASY